MMQVTKDTRTGLLYLCNVSQYGISGTYTCPLGAYTGLVYYKATTYNSPGVVRVSDWIQINSTNFSNLIGETEGGFWAIAIIMGCIMFGLISPVMGLFTLVVGLIAVYFLGLFNPITVTFIVIAAIVGMVIGFKVRV